MNQPLPLKPIHLPPAPSLWPPAPGWWLLAILVLCLIALGIWLTLRWQAQRRKRAWLAARLAQLEQAPNANIELHRLLRRAIQPLLTPAQSGEQHWPSVLQQLAGQAVPELTELESARYQPNNALSTKALAQADAVLQLALLHPKQAQKRLAGGGV